MTDVHDKLTRSYNMSRIRSRDTKPEMIVRKYLHSEGFRYRLYNPELPGKPDIVLKNYKSVIFINGCFWHGHDNCRYYKLPKTRTQWWKKKIDSNKERDEKNYHKLRKMNWNIIIIWECELKNKLINDTLEKLKKILKDENKE